MPQPYIYIYREGNENDMIFESGHKLAIDSGELKR